MPFFSRPNNLIQVFRETKYALAV